MNNKKVILINGNGSKWYEQAIFIVNDTEHKVPKNIVFEAEKIINEYLNKKYPSNVSNVYNNSTYHSSSLKTLKKSKTKKSNKNLNKYLNISIFCTISIIFCLAYLIWA